MNAARRLACTIVFFAALVTSSSLGGPAHRAIAGAAQTPLILQSPTISRTQIAFVYGGDIWTVGRHGGAAQRLVTGMGLAGAPAFSPDGSRVAFSADYEGSIDVYTVAAGGGEPHRVTYRPGFNLVVGWTPDGGSVIFRSDRKAATDAMQLYTIPAGGGEAAMLPLPDAQTGSFNAAKTHFAYVPNGQWEPYWQDYRGGQTTPVWIADMADSSVTAIPRQNSNDRDPMWIGNTIYFLSDRDGPFTLFAYDPRTHGVKRLLPSGGFGIVAASANGGEIVYSTFDAIRVYDTANGADAAVPITLGADMPEVRPHYINVGDQIQNADISPTGVRAVFEAHGDIITVPAENGSIRNITATPAIEERDPAWSPDGKSIAYFSDADGEYDLRIRDQRGLDPERKIALDPHGSFFYGPRWSPDGKRIAYSDKHLGMYYVDVSGSSRPVKFAMQPFEQFAPVQIDGGWSPDSRYIVFSNTLRNFEHAIFIYDTRTHETHQITDGMSDATSPVFDASGKYVYFLASTNTGLTADSLDMTSDERPTTSSIYAVTLQSDTASPTAPKTAEEAGVGQPSPSPSPSASAAPGAKPMPAPPKPIDFAGIDQRIVALPMPAANYQQIGASTAGSFLVSAAPDVTVGSHAPALSLQRFDLETRKPAPIAAAIAAFAVSHDGKKVLLKSAGRWYITSATTAFKPADGLLPTNGMTVRSVPHEEWAQMYRETWRLEREFFYDPHFHGLDLPAAEKRFAVFLPGLASRADLSYLTREMIGYLEVGHLWVSGGSRPAITPANTGLLGADYTLENGRYRVARIYSGQNWNPDFRAPLTGPGVNVHVGDYILAVNGRDVAGGEQFYAAFGETANQQTTLTVGPNPDKAGSHDITVVPVASEFNLRNLAWIEHNRETVDKLSGGKLAYVYMPDTGLGGYTNFNRYFFAQVGKAGVILDERYNHGGQIADYVIDYLNRKPRAVLEPRDGASYDDPPLAIFGPKVMLINEYAGSGGDAMPWFFRKEGLGPLVGERTWGGLVGIGGYPNLMDGGSVMAPRVGIGGLHGHWEVEGHGVAPDIAVQADPKLWREGHDAQLEAGVRTAMAMLKAHPVPVYPPPPYPNHHPVIPQ